MEKSSGPSINGYSGVSDFTANTIIHEICHAIGLSHGGEDGSLKTELLMDPNDSRYTTNDTIMSYNFRSNLSLPSITSLDKSALEEVWGSEFNLSNNSLYDYNLSQKYKNSFSDYKFYNRGDGNYQITADTEWDSTSKYDYITGISKITFTDKEIDVRKDIQGTFDHVTVLNTDSGEMFSLYNAAFARFPDADGLKYWIDQFSSEKNTRRVVAQSFLGSAEFTEKYGSNVSDETYVNNLYKNVLGRDADTEGLNYWAGNLSSGLETRYEALLGFAESTENKALFTEMTGFG